MFQDKLYIKNYLGIHIQYQKRIWKRYSELSFTTLKELNSNFVTVSGSLDNKTNPEVLYRKCGFIDNDVWYICKK